MNPSSGAFKVILTKAQAENKNTEELSWLSFTIVPFTLFTYPIPSFPLPSCKLYRV